MGYSKKTLDDTSHNDAISGIRARAWWCACALITFRGLRIHFLFKFTLDITGIGWGVRWTRKFSFIQPLSSCTNQRASLRCNARTVASSPVCSDTRPTTQVWSYGESTYLVGYKSNTKQNGLSRDFRHGQNGDFVNFPCSHLNAGSNMYGYSARFATGMLNMNKLLILWISGAPMSRAATWFTQSLIIKISQAWTIHIFTYMCH